MLAYARAQARADVELEAESAGFHHRNAISRKLSAWLTRYADAPFGTQFACFIALMALLVAAFSLPLIWSLRAVMLLLICFILIFPVWGGWYMWRDIKRDRRFPSVLVWDRQAWYLADWTMGLPPRFERPLSGAELKYVHAQFLESARIDATAIAGTFLCVVGAVGLFRGKDAIQHTAERIGRDLPFIHVALLGVLAYVTSLMVRHRATERELLRGSVEHYAELRAAKEQHTAHPARP